MEGDVITVERFIAAEPEAIFALLADPVHHPRIDGSGTVKEVKSGAAEHLALGSTFGMSMKMGVGYSMVNTVVEYDENRRIAWQARLSGPVGRLVGGRIWRYELQPANGGTRVRESWDISQDHQRVFLKLGKLPEQTRDNMDKTLRRIDEVLTAPPG